MSTPTETVEAFCTMASEGYDGLRRALKTYFTPETDWINVGLARTTGIEEAIALCDQLDASMGVNSIRIEMSAIAETGHKVLTERFDEMIDADGNVTHRDAVMGIFEVDGDKITAWRDYFDSASAVQRAS